MMDIAISAEKLHHRNIRTGNESIKGSSVFPFFDRIGRIKQLMLLLPDSDDIFMIDWKLRLISVPLWGYVRVSADKAALKRHSYFKADTLSGLYHFDPWWMLSDSRFDRHWAKELLKCTNCADRFIQQVKSVQFQRDLSMVRSLIIQSGPLNLSFQSVSLRDIAWRPEPARVKPDQQLPGTSRRQWRLDPFWNSLRKQTSG